MEMLEKAFAKLNLTLDIVRKRPDGYHDMRMIMQSVSLCDDVFTVVKPGSGKVSVITDKGFLPKDADNIAGKAAKEFFAFTGINDADVEIRLTKRIPVCAGMAGGSSDGAAVLRALNNMLGAEMTVAQLCTIGEKVGSDVPYCVIGGTALAEGRGEKLTPLPELRDAFFAIVKPRFSVQTPVLFSRIKCDKIAIRPDTDGAIKALAAGDILGTARRCYNVFEDALARERAEVDFVKDKLFDLGAAGACMTGTGSAVYGMFVSEKDAKNAVDVLSGKYRDCFFASCVKAFEL